MMELVSRLNDLNSHLEMEIMKFQKGNKAAGVRARRIAQEIKAAAQTIRVEIQVVRGRLEFDNDLKDQREDVQY
jgi:hypothetical protein